MKRLAPALFTVLMLVDFSFAGAQSPTTIDPPPILKITKIVVKPGTIAEVVKLEAERAQVFKGAKWPRTSIANMSVTGPKQIWIFARYNTLEDLAQDDQFAESTPSLKNALDRIDREESPFLESRRDITATYRPDISYRPKFDWSEVHYWDIIWVHLRTGHHDAYIENRRMTREEHEKGAFDTHQMMYAVQSGEPSGTYMVIRPMKTLGLLDALHAANDGEPVTPEDKKKKIELYAESGVSEEEAYFRLDQLMTYIPQP